MAQMTAFSRIIRQLQLHPGAPVAVAVSGGSDSIALTHLCRHAFKKVLAITVDHKLRPESSSEAEIVGETVRGMGVEHQILTLDWDEMPHEGKVQVQARQKRYDALLEACQARDIRVLMTGHHRDDQLGAVTFRPSETFLFRLARGSGISGLAGMYPVSYWPTHSAIKIVRPLLKWNKEELVQVCQEAGLQWVVDPTNTNTGYWRNAIRQVLKSNPVLYPGLLQLTDLCKGARKITDRAVAEAVWRVHHINTEFGYIELKVDRFKELSPPVAMRTLSILLKCISRTGTIHSRILERFCDGLRNPESMLTCTGGGCIVDTTVWKDRGVVIIAQQVPKRHVQKLTTICIGETILWDGIFEITLNSLGVDPLSWRNGTEIGELDAVGGTMKATFAKQHKNRTFYVRRMIPGDWMLVKKGIRRFKSTVLPPLNLRSVLPVIVDDKLKVVLVPHFRVIDSSAGVTCKIAFKPRRSLEDLLRGKIVTEEGVEG